MLNKRHWGLLKNVFSRIPITNWDFTGTVSFEDRCLSVYETHISKFTKSKLLLRVDDEASRYTFEIETKTDANLQKFSQLGYPNSEIFRLRLIEPIGAIFNRFEIFLENSSGNLVIDMSSMPKRMLFPILKLALDAKNINNIVVTYTIPEKYTSEQLAEDTEPVTNFPGMGLDVANKTNPELIIVCLGYLQIDLVELKQQLNGDVPVRVIFPFPPGAPAYQRNWQLLLSLFNEENKQNIPEPIRVDARDPSYLYDVLQDLTKAGVIKAIMLPFGPKPHSLAMALNSLKNGHELLYTQPKVYHPEYSSGVKKLGDEIECYGYVVKLNGNSLY